MAIKRGGHSSGPLREGRYRRGSTGLGVGDNKMLSKPVVGQGGELLIECFLHELCPV